MDQDSLDQDNYYLNNLLPVLVSVSSFQTLKKAYPNYFSDIGEFVTIIKNEIAKYKKYSKKGLEEN